MLAYTLKESRSLLTLLAEAEQSFRTDPEREHLASFLQVEITRLQFRIWEHEHGSTDGEEE